jgi:exopolysaccharide biosynthesis polyprenyl glycosylphosphotransferase
MPRVVAACTLGSAIGLLFPLAGSEGGFGYLEMLLFWPLATGTTLGLRYGLHRLAERRHARHPRRVIIVGSGRMAHELSDRMCCVATSGYDLLGFVDTTDEIRLSAAPGRMLGRLEDLPAILMHTVVDEVFIALPVRSHYVEIQRAIEDCESAGVQSRYSAHVFPSRLARPHVDVDTAHPGVTMKVVCDDYRSVVKRAIDIVGAGLGLLALSPVLVGIALAVKLTSAGPVLYRQERYGWRKRRFQMLKYRTMVDGAERLQAALEACNEAGGPLFKIADDPRVTRIGRILRRTSLDELPQLWNVLRGDMSLVGPRPLPIRDVSRFSEAWLMRRFSVPPGMTGLWQVSGRSALDFAQCTALDLQYIDEWSLWLDLKLLARTIPAVVRMDGAS